jgi:hypothetical protein
MSEACISQPSKLTITLQGKEGAIGIHKGVYRIIGCPRYVSLRISYKNNTLMIRPCESKDVMSFQAPKDFLSRHNSNFRVHSLQFVQNLLESNSLDQQTTYILEGTFSKLNNAVIFPIDTAASINSSDPACNN